MCPRNSLTASTTKVEMALRFGVTCPEVEGRTMIVTADEVTRSLRGTAALLNRRVRRPEVVRLQRGRVLALLRRHLPDAARPSSSPWRSSGAGLASRCRGARSSTTTSPCPRRAGACRRLPGAAGRNGLDRPPARIAAALRPVRDRDQLDQCRRAACCLAAGDPAPARHGRRPASRAPVRARLRAVDGPRCSGSPRRSRSASRAGSPATIVALGLVLNLSIAAALQAFAA